MSYNFSNDTYGGIWYGLVCFGKPIVYTIPTIGINFPHFSFYKRMEIKEKKTYRTRHFY